MGMLGNQKNQWDTVHVQLQAKVKTTWEIDDVNVSRGRKEDNRQRLQGWEHSGVPKDQPFGDTTKVMLEDQAWQSLTWRWNSKPHTDLQ